MHGITPEAEFSKYYFGFSVRKFRHGDEALDAFQYESECTVRPQDVKAIEAVEARLEQAVQRQRELLVRSDGPAIKVRRMINALLEQDQVVNP